ncbi:MAG: hypothetical protein ACYC96_00115 [Fimbriimonadaceae bacterium]
MGLAVLAGCRAGEGEISAAPPDAGAVAASATAVRFRYAPANAMYRYALTTVTNVGDPNAHTTELDFAVKVTKQADRYIDESTLEKSLVDGAPRRGITPAALSDFKLTSVLDAHGAITSAHGAGTELFVARNAKDLGTSFELPRGAIKPGDTWTRQLGSGADEYTLTYKFVGEQQSGAVRIATFEERASSKKGEKVDQPTLISIDANTGVLLDKVAVTGIPTGPKPTDPVIPVRSEIRLR